MFENMDGNIPGGSFPDTNIFATSKNFPVKSLLSSILKEYIYIICKVTKSTSNKSKSVSKFFQISIKPALKI